MGAVGTGSDLSMLYAPLPSAPTGYFPNKLQRGDGKKPKPGCQNGWCWQGAPTMQEFTFFLSWAVQLAVLITSSVAMGSKGVPPALMLILSLETGVQAVEFFWYTGVALLYVCGPYWGKGASIDVGYRYVDWMITTPLMLVSLMFFGLWEANRCVRIEDLLGAHESRVVALIFIVLMDLWMLVVGSSYANRNPDGGALGRLWEGLATWYDRWIFWDGGENAGIFVGWLPFLGAFAPLFVMMATDKFKIGGQLSISISFVAWAVYGAIAVLRYWNPPWRPAGKAAFLSAAAANTAYNLMDIVSKNIMGVVVSAVVFNSDYSDGTLNCTVYDGRPYEWGLLTNGTVG